MRHLDLPVARRALLATTLAMTSCASPDSHDTSLANRLTMKYATVRLESDLSQLAATDRAMLPLLIDAAREIDAIFWEEAWGDPEALLASAPDDATRRFLEINYGPWDRLDDNRPFLPGVGAKPPGARFYPEDLTKDEFLAYVAAHPGSAEALRSLYTVVVRGEDGSLDAVPYHVRFARRTERAVELLERAALLASDPGFRRYLGLRVRALLTDDYRESDLAWLDMKDNAIDVVIGPIETYEDALFGQKAAHEAYVLVKDREWSRRLERYAQMLPALQRALPVPAQYKREAPGSDSDLNAYDVVYYAGDSNAGSKTIAINLPNDETVQLEKGTRRLQLKNAMRAKFERILVPIADLLIADDQRHHVTFDAFFDNVMFHEVAHGLGIKNTIDGSSTVREKLADEAGALEEGKADVLGLYLIARLFADGELTSGSLEDHYVTFLAGIFRSVRFGAASAHGRANMLRFNFFERAGAFTRDPATGTYRCDFPRMAVAVEELSRRILVLQGDGDYAGVKTLMAELGDMDDELRGDLARLASGGIPVDVVFEQGAEVLGLR